MPPRQRLPSPWPEENDVTKTGGHRRLAATAGKAEPERREKNINKATQKLFKKYSSKS